MHLIGSRAQAHGDLDGDGIASTFEVTGHYADGDARGGAAAVDGKRKIHRRGKNTAAKSA